jgi:hypothetical protein
LACSAAGGFITTISLADLWINILIGLSLVQDALHPDIYGERWVN